MDLENLAGPAWAGWTISESGLLFAPEWRQGLHSGHIRALPYLHAAIAEHQRSLSATKKALADMEGLFFAAERQARFYRSQLILESRYGLMFASPDTQP